ncbi:uncharacterized protein [Ambystoma mexicanum]|uniref:uncharacterized protein isoform X2 n=1 Tax=Ambystoma mexicanum TaxID=8296 RepID=UPI0037E81477
MDIMKQRRREELPGPRQVPEAEKSLLSKFKSATAVVDEVHPNSSNQKLPVTLNKSLCQDSVNQTNISCLDIYSSKTGQKPISALGLFHKSANFTDFNEMQINERFEVKRPMKLAPLEIPLEVKQAQLQKIMGIKDEAKVASEKLSIPGAINRSNEPHAKKVKNLPQMELAILHKMRLAEKALLENKKTARPNKASSLKDTTPLRDDQIASQDDNSNMKKKQAHDYVPDLPYRSTIPKLKAPILKAPLLSDLSSDPALPHSMVNGRLWLKSTVDGEANQSKCKPLKFIGLSMTDSLHKTMVQSTAKAIFEAGNHFESELKNRTGRREGAITSDLEVNTMEERPPSRRMVMRANINEKDE